MARQRRKISVTGMYHIILRANSVLFLSSADYEHFVTLMRKYFVENQKLYAYCLMENHVHFLINQEGDKVFEPIKPLCTSYARYFNKCHGKNGKLFYDRYKSECIENDNLAAVIKFIHENPKYIGINDWKYSSEAEYRDGADICAVDAVFEKTGGRENYFRFAENGQIKMFLDDYSRMEDDDISHCIKIICGCEAKDIKYLDRIQKYMCIEKIKADNWISNRRIAKVTGIDRNTIDRAGAVPKISAKPKDEKTGLDIWLL
ncbi:MAG: transposase [Clostridia bacterium]|nr:transposase [Clostridia bacterium]